ncbi:cupredoxin domain-containing protein [Conexibacter stalactiti]|uniref:EfeO-type cupredoxin-like domain-containing protein n=1 Tax=Conexibacter stalactiti TaxID=1940611 RepID=A0ABU4HM34_9ACTN|nr:hypothetical protein [Conexibacter stalactiti]MEC5034424.1 cupredoxin domain-containing protein [Conexibacter stalactiti]
MRSRGLLLCAVLGAALTAAAATGVAASAPDGPSAAFAAAPFAAPAAKRPVSTAVGVSQREFRLTPYRGRVPAGEVRFYVTNFGEDVHDLVVRDTRGRVIKRSPEIRAGARASVTVKLRRGRYRLSCDVADHAQRGMRAALTVVRP